MYYIGISPIELHMRYIVKRSLKTSFFHSSPSWNGPVLNINKLCPSVPWASFNNRFYYNSFSPSCVSFISIVNCETEDSISCNSVCTASLFLLLRTCSVPFLLSHWDPRCCLSAFGPCRQLYCSLQLRDGNILKGREKNRVQQKHKARQLLR